MADANYASAVEMIGEKCQFCAEVDAAEDSEAGMLVSCVGGGTIAGA
jgi:hypothetical protein